MNKIYNVVWDAEKQCFVVASELAKGHKKTGSARLSLAIAGALLVGGLSAPAMSATSTGLKAGLDLMANYYSVNDGGVQGGNYNSDGATGADALAAGVGASAAGGSGVAIGTDASASGDSAIAVGDSSVSTGLMTTAIGSGAQAIADTSTALGSTTSATGFGSTAVGYGANAAGSRALASGYGTSASGDNSTALGNSAKALAADAVALGSKSSANTAAGIAGYVPATATAAQAAAINATKSTLGAVSVGDAATNKFRQITSVAAGTADSDAVNVAQLKGATADAVLYDSSAHDSVTLGGPAYNPVTKTGGTRISNVANGVAPSDAVNVSQLDDLANTPLTFTGNSGTVQKKLGDTMSIQGKGTTPGTYAGDNLRTEVDANGVLQVEMTDKPAFTSVTAGNTTIDTNGVTISGGPSVTTNGINAGGQKIGNVAAGTALTDAVNLNQLSTAVDGAKSHYYSVNDGGVQSGNYDNDGATGTNALAAGVSAGAAGNAAVAVGPNASASGTSSVAMGDGSVSIGLMTTGVGANAQALSDTATALGSTTSATGFGSTAVGFGANAAGARSLASGYGASASADSSIAMGNSAKALVADGVALGSKSVASTAAGIAGYVPATASAAQAAAINATKSTLGAVSVGDAASSKFRQITGVAAGTADSDAVNVAQLKGATADAVLYDSSAHDSVTLGGPSYNPVTKTGGTKITNVANGVAPSDAVNVSQLDDLANTPLTFAGNNGTVQKKLGDTMSIQGKGTTPGTYVGDNLRTEVDANGVLQVEMTDKPVFTSVTTGNTTVDTNGVTINGGPSVTVNGIDAGGQKISNVAAGDVTDTSTDAINGSQLKKVQDAANAGWNVTDASNNTANIGPNGKVTFKGDSNVTVNQTGVDNDGQVEVNLNKNLDLGDTGSVTTGNTSISNNGVTISGGPSVTVNGIDAGGQKISNVAAGDVTETSTDAINGSQLKKVQDAANAGWNVTDASDNTANIGPNGKVTFKGDSNVTVNQTGVDNDGQVEVNLNKNLDLGDTGSVTTGNTSISNNGLTIAGGPSITVSGIDAGGTKITNVAAGTAPTDAVNLSQLTTTVNGAKTHYYSVNDSGTQGGNYNNDGATGANAIAAGVGATATGASSTAMGNNAQANNDNDVALGAGSVTSKSNPIASVTVGGQTYQFAGASPTSVVSVGSKGNERQVTNVAAGQLSGDSTDAVNGSQLYATNQAVDVLNSTITNINGGGGIKYFHANSSLADSQAVGSNSVAVGPQAISTGTDSVAVGNGATASTNNSVALGANSATGPAKGTSGATIAGDNYTFAGANPTGTVSVGTAGQERTITNVAAGTLSSTSTDAVNGSQLYATNQAVDKLDGRVTNVENTVNNIAGDITNISTGQAGMFQTSADQKAPAPTPTGNNSAAGGAGAAASGDNSLALGNGSQATANNSVAIGNGSVADRANAVSMGSAGNERQITNIAAGTQGSDAVNVSQLKAAQAGGVQYDVNSDGSINYNSVTLNPNGGSASIHNVQAGTATTDAVNVGQLNDAMINTQNWAKNYTDQQVNQMGKRAYAGTASALAAANIPQAYQPNQSILGVGIGNYHGQSAISVGMSTITESGRYILKASATGSQQDGFGVGVGAGVAW